MPNYSARLPLNLTEARQIVREQAEISPTDIPPATPSVVLAALAMVIEDMQAHLAKLENGQAR